MNKQGIDYSNKSFLVFFFCCVNRMFFRTVMHVLFYLFIIVD